MDISIVRGKISVRFSVLGRTVGIAIRVGPMSFEGFISFWGLDDWGWVSALIFDESTLRSESGVSRRSDVNGVDMIGVVETALLVNPSSTLVSDDSLFRPKKSSTVSRNTVQNPMVTANVTSEDKYVIG
jgi:hypothetical protein